MPATAPYVAELIARSRAKKRANAGTAAACGCLLAATVGTVYPAAWPNWVSGFLIGLVWANAFEYFLHRFLLHWGRGLLVEKHLLHHASVGRPDEPEYVNLAGSPVWIVALFVVNALPALLADWALGWRVAAAMFLGFGAYLIVEEEMHWRIHLGGRLPPGLRFAKRHHLAHHARPETRFNVFLPLFDRLLGTSRG